MPELAQQAADHIGHLGTLPNSQVASAMDRQQRLLILSLYLDKARSAPLNDPPDRSIRWRGSA